MTHETTEGPWVTVTRTASSTNPNVRSSTVLIKSDSTNWAIWGVAREAITGGAGPGPDVQCIHDWTDPFNDFRVHSFEKSDARPDGYFAVSVRGSNASIVDDRQVKVVCSYDLP
jgi:hypothetical protein